MVTCDFKNRVSARAFAHVFHFRHLPVSACRDGTRRARGARRKWPSRPPAMLLHSQERLLRHPHRATCTVWNQERQPPFSPRVKKASVVIDQILGNRHDLGRYQTCRCLRGTGSIPFCIIDCALALTSRLGCAMHTCNVMRITFNLA